MSIGLQRWMQEQPSFAIDGFLAASEGHHHGDAVAMISSEVLAEKYVATLAKAEEAIVARRAMEESLTRTTAALIFTPELRVAQPALIQSFSIRNLFQLASPDSDPDDVRAQVRTDLLRTQGVAVLHSGRSTDIDLRALTPKQFEHVVDAVVAERLRERTWLTRADILSLDIGIAAGAAGVGNTGRRYDREVDKDFPQFLFGGGLHFGPLEFSAGIMLYRDPQSRFEEAFYAGVSIDLFEAHFGLKKLVGLED